jgi:hypothetical protein
MVMTSSALELPGCLSSSLSASLGSASGIVGISLIFLALLLTDVDGAEEVDEVDDTAVAVVVVAAGVGAGVAEINYTTIQIIVQ